MKKVLKATISGSFIAGDKDTESYDNVTGFLPALDEDKASQMIIKRYARIWIGQAQNEDGSPKYKRVGRMNYEELQDLAAAKDLISVPLYKTGSLTLARRIAFSAYAIEVLDKPKKQYDYRVEGFRPAAFQPIIADGAIRRSYDANAPLEESIDREMMREELGDTATSVNSRLTMEQLKNLAKAKGVEFGPKIGYDALYRKCYPNAA